MSASSPSSTAGRDRALIRRITLLSLAAFGSAGAARIADPLLPQLALEFAVSAGQAAHAVSFFALAYGLFQLLYGPLGDRFGKYRVIAWAVLAGSVGALGSALATDFSWLLVFRTLNGMACAAAIPLAMAWIADNVPYERRQPVLAYFLIGQIFGVIAGQALGGLFADLTGWRGAFWFMVVTFAAVGTLLVTEVRRSPDIDAAASTANRDSGFLQRFAAVGRVPWARFILLGVCIEGAAVFGGLAFVPSYLFTRFGLSLTQAGALMALFGIGGLSYAVFARHFVAGLGERGLALSGGLALGLAFLLLVVAPHWSLALPAAWLAGIGFYMLHNTFQLNATQMVPEHRGTAVALFASCLFLGQAGGVSLNAWIIDQYGYAPAFALPALVLATLGLLFAARIARRPVSA